RTHLVHATAGQKPNEGYDGAQKDADVVREALRTCHEVMADLPYYSQWLARRYVYEENDRSAVNEQVKAAEELWENLHYLVRQVAVTSPEEMQRRLTMDVRLETRDPDAGLQRQTATVRTAFERLRERFDKECQKLAEEVTFTQGTWHAANDALTVPLIEPKLRLRLVNRPRRISRKWLRETQGKVSEAALSAEANAKMARESASRNGRLALAALGPRWFEDDQFRAAEAYGKTQSAVKENVEDGW